MYKLDKMLEHPKADIANDATILSDSTSDVVGMDNQQAKRDDLNWLAGHFEGEGTLNLSLRSTNNGIQPTIAYTNTDYDLVTIFADITKKWICGCHIASYPERYLKPNGKAKPFYRIAICGLKRTLTWLDAVIPFIRAKSQRERAILMRDFLQSRLGKSYQRYTKEEVGLAERFWKVNSSRRGLRDQTPSIREKIFRMVIESSPS